METVNIKSPAEAKKINESICAIDGAFVAGGAVRSLFTNEPVNDFDVYFKTRKDFENAVAGAYDNGWWNVSTTKRAVTFSDHGGTPIQFMYFDFFESPSKIFDAFDFTIVMGAYDFVSGEFILHADFMRHNSQRFLKFHPGTRYPIASSVRVLKYLERGYTIGMGEMIKIALACRKPYIESWDDLKDQIGGSYGEKVVVDSTEEFHIDAAISEISKDNFIAENDDSPPGTAIGLFEKIAEMNGVEFDPSLYDDDGYRI